MNRVKGSQFRDVMLFPNPSPSQGSPCLDVTKISRRRQLRDNCPTFVQASLISPPCHWFPESREKYCLTARRAMSLLNVCWAAPTPFTFLPSPALNFIDPGSLTQDVVCSWCLLSFSSVRNFCGSHSLFSISGGSSPESMFSGREELVLLEQLVTPSSGLRFYLLVSFNHW